MGYLTGSFAVSLLFASVWLIFCRLVPPLRYKYGFSYIAAVFLAFIPALITVNVSDENYITFLGAFLCTGLLFWNYKRARKKLEKKNETNENSTP